jgi:hypothetical protein
MRLHGRFLRIYPYGIRLKCVWEAFGAERRGCVSLTGVSGAGANVSD